MSAVKEYLIRSLEQELENFDTVVDTTEARRADLTNRVTDLAKQALTLTPEDLRDPKVVTAAMSILSTSMKALNDQEATATRRINAKIKQADQQRADATSDLVVDMLRRMGNGQLIEPPKDTELNYTTIEGTIDSIMLDNSMEVLDAELRENPNDLS